MSDYESYEVPKPFNWREYLAFGCKTGLGVAVVAGGLFLASGYRVCQPNQYMIRTGLGIPNMLISKTGFEFPFQKSTILNLNPTTYSFDLHNMSKEKVEFKLPVSFTIGPMDPLINPNAFKRFATTMNDLGQSEMEKMIQSIVEGETRSLTATLTIEEMFESKDKFRSEVIDKIQTDLDREFGMHIYTGTIREMGDLDSNNKYFEFRKQRAIQTANYESQVDVSRAKREGEIGTKDQEKQTRVSVAEMEKDATIRENEYQQAIAESKARLVQVREAAKLKESLAVIEATNEASKRKEEMEREVEQLRAIHVLETMRANDLNLSKVASERIIVDSQGKARSIEIQADAHLYQIQRGAEELLINAQKEAEATFIKAQKEAEGNFIKAQKEADGNLIKAQKEAEGILALLNAQATGMRDLSTSADPAFLQFYLGLEKGLPQELARYHAETVKNLKPQISLWNTGSEPNSSLLPITNMIQSMAPLIDGFQKHTKIKLPIGEIKPVSE